MRINVWSSSEIFDTLSIAIHHEGDNVYISYGDLYTYCCYCYCLVERFICS